MSLRLTLTLALCALLSACHTTPADKTPDPAPAPEPAPAPAPAPSPLAQFTVFDNAKGETWIFKADWAPNPKDKEPTVSEIQSGKHLEKHVRKLKSVDGKVRKYCAPDMATIDAYLVAGGK